MFPSLLFQWRSLLSFPWFSLAAPPRPVVVEYFVELGGGGNEPAICPQARQVTDVFRTESLPGQPPYRCTASRKAPAVRKGSSSDPSTTAAAEAWMNSRQRPGGGEWAKKHGCRQTSSRSPSLSLRPYTPVRCMEQIDVCACRFGPNHATAALPLLLPDLFFLFSWGRGPVFPRGEGSITVRVAATTTGCPNHVNWPFNPGFTVVSCDAVAARQLERRCPANWQRVDTFPLAADVAVCGAAVLFFFFWHLIF